MKVHGMLLGVGPDCPVPLSALGQYILDYRPYVLAKGRGGHATDLHGQHILQVMWFASKLEGFLICAADATTGDVLGHAI